MMKASLLPVRLLALLGAALAAGTAAAQQVSPAESLLFETDHLARLQAPAVLTYDFTKVSNVEPGFSDKVRLEVSGHQGAKSAGLQFLSGEHKQEIPRLDDAHGNPVLLGFLERDIAEMKRLTGGSTSYFRKRIRMALANTAQVAPQTITWQGKPVQAKVVRIQPYLGDPMHARFEKYVRKTYAFVLSDLVPGGVYQVHTSLGGEGAGRAAPGASASGVATSTGPAPAALVIEETLTLAGAGHPQH